MSSSSSICVSEEDNDENRLDSNETEFLTSQKNLIYKHPLFPVLVYVLERCEQATVNPSLLANQDDTQTSSSSSFEHNLKLFLSKNPSLLNHTKSSHNEETSIIDNFYIDAMQVLRIHLLELDKVNDLCRDFCQRYIACLKVKLNANTLFAGDEDDDYDDVDIVDDDDDEDIGSHIDDDYQSNDEMDHDSSDDEQNSSTFQHRINRKQTTYSNYTTEFDGQTPLSQIISKGSSKAHDPMSCSPDESPMKRRKQAHLVTSLCQSSKRGVLPKSATSIMRSWLFQHIVHPYPTEDEKRAISHKTNLSLLQVNNWFINARRRILQPMLEASNPDLAANKKKKKHESISDEHHHSTQHRQMSNINRYWPSTLVQFDTNNVNQCKK